MDRAKVKAATQGARAGGAAAKATSISDVFPGPRSVVLGGETFDLGPLDFNDLIEVEDQWGDTQDFLAKVDEGKLRAVRFFVWLMLRKSKPDLTLTEAGALVPLTQKGMEDLLGAMAAAAGFEGTSDPNEAGAGAEQASVPSTGS